MAVISLNTNVASQRTQRLLSETTRSLGLSFSRLSSGLRITRPSDDAAGLAVASSLSLDSRVFTQAVRNVNDVLSAAAIAQGSMSQLASITTRTIELAEQAANGTLTAVQRIALDREAQALRQEFASTFSQ